MLDSKPMKRTYLRIQKSILFNLSEMLKTHTLPSTKEIENILNKKTGKIFNKSNSKIENLYF